MPLGIPHSVFKGWPQLDQDKALAWQRRQRETHSCGVHPEVWDEDLGGDLGNLHMESRFCGACQYEHAAQKEAGQMAPGRYLVWASPPADASDVGPDEQQERHDPGHDQDRVHAPLVAH